MRLRIGLIAFTFVFFEFRSKVFDVKCVFKFSQKVFKLRIHVLFKNKILYRGIKSRAYCIYASFIYLLSFFCCIHIINEVLRVAYCSNSTL